MLRNFTDDTLDIVSDEGQELAAKLIEHIRERLVHFQESSGHMYNLEATPAEATTYRFAKEDIKRYPEIIQAGDGENRYYTNSSQLPVGHTDDPFQALDLQDRLQTLYTGGTVLHLYMNEQISSADACRKLVQRTARNYRTPYFTVTPTFSICPEHGYLSGHHEFCPKCDEKWFQKQNQQQEEVLDESTCETTP
jgi:ribonucleoside-triphosphate reductase